MTPEADMHIFDAILRSVIQAVVMAVWGVFTLAFLAGMIGRIIRFRDCRPHDLPGVFLG